VRVPIDFHRTSTRPTSQSHPILLNQSISFPPSGSYRLPLSPRIPTLRTQLTETQCQCISQSTPLPCTVNQRHVEETFTRCQVQRSWRQRRGGEGSEGGRGGNDVRACGRVRGNQSKCGGVTTSLWSDFASYPSFLPPCFLPFLPSIQHNSSSIVIVVDRRRRRRWWWWWWWWWWWFRPSGVPSAHLFAFPFSGALCTRLLVHLRVRFFNFREVRMAHDTELLKKAARWRQRCRWSRWTRWTTELLRREGATSENEHSHAEERVSDPVICGDCVLI